eukprot:TRINITY_DN40531_c0_g1_i1.p1 TRINITY_DN40531_c0_g1~~TRINITY_DN40531_c0_g1_i1.p1  ORF type:complete len:448 (+),score=134.81 TRINITY_DN40531_c0_g1_i1:55-1344(+)
MAVSGVGRTMFVAGGSGFIGSNVCREAIREGFRVVSLSRTGRPEHIREKWADLVEWRRGDVQVPKTFVEDLRPADAVVSCIGRWGWGSSAALAEVNGELNVALAQLVHRECPNLSKFAFFSASPWSVRMQTPFRSYFQGKQQAELIIQALFPNNYVIMRPTWVFGWKHLAGPVWIPWHLLGAPLEHLMHPLGIYYKHSKRTVPPNYVDELARVTVMSCTVGRDIAGVIPAGRVRDILEREAQNRPLADWLRPELLEHMSATKQYIEETNYSEKFGLREIKRKGWENFLINARKKLNPASTRPEFVHPTKSTEYMTDMYLTEGYRLERNHKQLLLAEKNRKKHLMFQKAREQAQLAGEQRLLGEVPSAAEQFLQAGDTRQWEAATPRGSESRPKLIVEQGLPNPPPTDIDWKLKQQRLMKHQGVGTMGMR